MNRVLHRLGAASLVACLLGLLPANAPAQHTSPQNATTITAAQLAAQLANAEQFFSSPYPQQPSLNIFLQAADLGNAAARRDLGLLYNTGWLGSPGHDPDPEQALQWFESASLAGDTRAASYIGDFYLHPTNGTPDPANALYWYQKGSREHDARSTVALALLSCNGTAVPQDVATCGQLLDLALRQQKPGDPADVRTSLQTSLLTVGHDYQAGHGIARSPTAAAGWYARSAALGSTDAALAECRLYVEPLGLPQNLPHALRLLDTFVAAQRKRPLDMEGHIIGQDALAAMYAEIGATYQAQGRLSLPRAAAVYTQAAKLGDGTPAIRLGVQYLQSNPANLNAAYPLLMGLVGLPIAYTDRLELYNALSLLADQLKAGTSATDQARLDAVMRAERQEALPVPMAADVAAPPPPPPPATPVQRFPNIAAPDTVPPLQTFAVQVSLNSFAFDANTTIMNGQQSNGQLQITLPDGLTSLPIQVDLIAPGMTFVDGSNTGTLTLTAAQTDSLPVLFNLRAGAAPASTFLIATLSYHSTIIGQLRRPIAIVAPAPPAPNPPAAPPGTDAVAPRMLTLLPPAQPVGQMPPLAPPAPAAQPLAPIDPTARAADLTILESRVGDTMIYSYYSVSGLQTPPPDTMPHAAATRALVQQDFAHLQAAVESLENGIGDMCKTARAKGAGSDADPSCDTSIQVRTRLRGIGNDLYANLAPPGFRRIFDLLKYNHLRLHSITINTDYPTLPWELMLPDPATDNFLGLTTAIVRENTSTIGLAPPNQLDYNGIAVILPTYTDPKLQLPGAQAEATQIQTDFPQTQSVEGDVDDVRTLLRSAVPSIVQYSGHGQRAKQPTAAALAPDVSILLEDDSMTPADFIADRAGGAPAHPFYFFNACDLGQSDPELNYLAGWAPALMSSGASGYMGALYEVGDSTASSFSAHFYAGLKASLAANAPLPLADIVMRARQQTYAEANDPTALAYVLYAKPFLAIVPNPDE